MVNKSLTLLLFLSIVLNSFAFGEEATNEEILISNITIEGNNRVTNNTVLSYAEVNIGDKFSPDLIKSIIKKLYATNYFDNISVVLEFNNLIINVVEKAIISDIKITGNEFLNHYKMLEYQDLDHMIKIYLIKLNKNLFAYILIEDDIMLK